MFFIRYLEREISIHPSFFGRDMEARLRERLFADMEGSCNGEYYIICVIDITKISPGRVKPGRGEAVFTISYRAILWKPFKGETVSLKIKIKSPTDIREIDCAVTNIKQQGIFCEAGPLTVFVSKLHLPPDMKYIQEAPAPQFVNSAGETIERGSAVRVQLIGLRSDVGQMFAIGKMSAPWFGAT